MESVVRRIQSESRSEEYKLWPLGDIHVGARGCDEAAFTAVVKQIEDDPGAYWLGMGDYINAVRRQDPRYSVHEMADWMTIQDTADIAKAERDRFLDLTRPIWGKCIGLLEGNHEASVLKWDERDVYHEIVSAIKPDTPWADEKMALSYSAFVQLTFQMKGNKTSRLVVYAHHGYGGGRLKGAKALRLQRAAWANVCDVVVIGHVHDEVIEPVYRMTVDANGNVTRQRTIAFHSGTFMVSHQEGPSDYAERAGYFAGDAGTAHLRLRPWLYRSNENGHRVEGFKNKEAIRVVL